MKKNKNSEKLRKRLIEVCTNWVKSSVDEELEFIKKDLDSILDKWASQDAFGTEGQNDPRGDTRKIDDKPKI